MPPPLPITDDERDLPSVLPYLTWWMRGLLLALAVLLSTVFAVAAYLRPYAADGTALTMETHRQLGLPPCTFKTATGGLPCPSCGMTTSFALLIHGDPVASLRANWVGTFLALFWLMLIPWSLASAWLRRPVLVRSMERGLSYAIIVFLTLMLLRWAVVMALEWGSRGS